MPIQPLDIPALDAWFQFGKNRQWHKDPAGCRHAQFLQPVQIALITHKPHDHIKLVLSVIRAIFRDTHAAGQHLDHRAKPGNRHTMPAGRITVCDQRPFGTRQRAAVGDIDKSAKLIHPRHQITCRRGEFVKR